MLCGSDQIAVPVAVIFVQALKRTVAASVQLALHFQPRCSHALRGTCSVLATHKSSLPELLALGSQIVLIGLTFIKMEILCRVHSK